MTAYGYRLLYGAIVLLTLSGCGWFGSEKTEQASDEFAELDLVLGDQQTPPAGEPTSLMLNLQVGDRFPLIKQVEQTLSQETDQGLITSHSTLQLYLAISVEEKREGQTRLGVSYHRVAYQHQLGGETVEFDSDHPDPSAPLAVQAYQGMINNGFSFWLGSDNRIQELVGFDAFLQRCLRTIPPIDRQSVLTLLSESAGENGVANFIDDSIGLLPFTGQGEASPQIAIGDSWTHSRTIRQPIPLNLEDRCVLREVQDQVARVELVGQISSSTLNGPPPPNSKPINVQVRGGHSVGNCTVDLQTGLPIQSRIERYLDMVVQVAQGEPFEQRKHIVTTVKAFPAQGAPLTASAPPARLSVATGEAQPIDSAPISGGTVRPVSGEQADSTAPAAFGNSFRPQ